jgi:peptide/nickel transport system substrate-binding protein
MAALGAAALLAVAGQASAFEREGGRPVLVLSGGQAVPVLDPHVRYDWSTRQMQQSIYDALAKYVGDPPKIIPWLAESWDVSADSTEWVFHLAKNAKFHDGAPLDAEAVKFSYQRALKLNKGVAWMLKDHLDPAGIEVVDAHAIKFKLKHPYPAFISFVPWWYIVNPKLALAHQEGADLGEKWLTTEEAGSGPFRVKRWDPNAVMQLDAVADYWKGWTTPADKRLAGVIYRIIREPAPRKAALQRGEVDIVTELTPDDYDQFKGVKGIVVPDHPGMTTFDVKMNNQHGPTADPNFRKALAYAFDYDAMVQIHNGAATLMTSPFPSALSFHVDVAGRPAHDPVKAKAYLAKTKWPSGGLELEYIYVQGLEEERRVGLAMLNALQPLNIKVNILAAPWTTLVARGTKPETTSDLAAVYVTPVSTDPDVVAMQYHPSAESQYWGMHHYKNPEVANLIETARVEPDAGKRRALYADIQQRIMADQPEIFGVMPNRRWAMRDYLKGFVYSPVRLTGEVDLYPMWIDAK